MAYHHLALAAKDMKATHAFYEGIMGFELVKVEVAPIMGGGWGKHFFYRMDGDDSRYNGKGAGYKSLFLFGGYEGRTGKLETEMARRRARRVRDRP